MVSEFTQPYVGKKRCERCKKVTASRVVRVPDPTEPPVYVCQTCADVWDGAVTLAIRNIARRLAQVVSKYGADETRPSQGKEKIHGE